MKNCLFALLGTVVVGCAAKPMNWALIEPYSPVTRATVVGINPAGASWFFQCDEQGMLSGFRIRWLDAPDGQAAHLSIRFDSDPVQESDWSLEKGTYILKGDRATQLARQAALAYNATISVDGATASKFPLTGSHGAMIRMTRDCPFLEVK